jgi:hypothetical protein
MFGSTKNIQLIYALLPGVSLGVNQLRRGVDHPPPSSAEVKEREELYLYAPSGFSWPVIR